MEGWRDGGTEGWRDAGTEGWRDGAMERWRDGAMEQWRDGEMERWRDGAMKGSESEGERWIKELVGLGKVFGYWISCNTSPVGAQL